MKAHTNHIYTIEVIIDYPWIEEDEDFNVEVELTEEEVNEIIQGGIRLLYKDSTDIQICEFVEMFSETAYGKLNALAESFAVQKWGDQMLLSNGAKYSFALPDEICSAIFDSPECIGICDKRKKQEDQSRFHFHSDVEILFSNNSKGRWDNRLLPDPHWGNKPFGGIWSGPSIGSMESNYSQYGIHCTIVIDGIKTEISYSAKYFLESYELELRVYEHNPKVADIFEDCLLEEGYLIKQRLPVGEPIYSYVIYSEDKDPTKFVFTYMRILDEIIKLN